MSELSALLSGLNLVCEKLNSEHYLENFSSGHSGVLSDWLCGHGMAYQQENLCQVWVLRDAYKDDDVTGYFTLSSHSIEIGSVNRADRTVDRGNGNRVASHPTLPAQLLGKFALDESAHGRNGLGALLMLCVYDRYLVSADNVGSKFLIAETEAERLKEYYKDSYGFTASQSGVGGLVPLYKTTASIRSDHADSLT